MKKKYLGIICILYALLITYVYLNKYLSNFIAPSMQKYILSSIPILFLMGIVLLINSDGHYKFKISDLVLILPIIMLIFAGDGKLSVEASNNRNTTFNSNRKTTVKNTTIDSEKNNSNDNEKSIENKTSTKQVDFEITDEVYSLLGDGITYNSKPYRLKGKTIRVKGFSVLKGDGIPDGYFGFGKYFVSCCTADAGFGGFIVKNDAEYNIENNMWYEIEGVIDTSKDSYGTDIGVINITSIKKINGKKEEMYVYPCYSYSDDACNLVSKYNIEY